MFYSTQKGPEVSETTSVEDVQISMNRDPRYTAIWTSPKLVHSGISGHFYGI